jgi:nucleoside-triphosphatase THEP1
LRLADAGPEATGRELGAAEPPLTMARSAPTSPRRIVFLTGAPEAGKTLVCQRLVESARHKGLRVSGLITEARRLSSGRIVQTVLNLRTGERRRLADYVGVDEGEPIGRGVAGRFSWTFVGESVRWGRHELDRCLTGSTDLLVIDQLGPLELLAGSGWVNAVRVLQEGRYGLAVVVVNPLVVAQLTERLDDAQVEEVEAAQAVPDELQVRLLRLALDSRLENGA